ncbi:MAG TPA: bile acid:sodium symporter family protein [Spirochaetota bacterium]|nr:bile acid:sodium symporter family protein [Spirochaetota bacterium]
MSKNILRAIKSLRIVLMMLCFATVLIFNTAGAFAGEQLYRDLSRAARDSNSTIISQLALQGEQINWDNAGKATFEGNLRFLESASTGTGTDVSGIFMVRRLDGKLHVVSVPSGGAADYYSGLANMLGHKLVFNALVAESTIDGRTFSFIRFLQRPEQLMLDRVFKISIVFMFFFVMLGMGLNLTINDFKLVLQKPRGIIIGIFLQWLLMPLLALGMAYAVGFYHSFPFIYAGIVLICACPGGVTSNLMTYYAKGDLALSVSLTSVSTVLALFFTPFILTVFCANIPDVKVPTGLIVQTIVGLVLVPLILGMSIRRKWLQFAVKATPFFSALGVVALLLVIGVGIFTNAEKFLDTARYSPAFYIMVVALSVVGMFVAAFFPKPFKVENYQIRAISIEVGLRNSTLAVTIALLIQDLMGDFHSSMFVTTAIYGITMYITGFLMIIAYKYILPLDDKK